jgi:hypothetical protein
MLRRVVLIRTDVSEERRASIIRVIRIGELGTTLAVTTDRRTLPILLTLRMDAVRSSETSVLTRATRRNIPEDGNSSVIAISFKVISLEIIYFNLSAVGRREYGLHIAKKTGYPSHMEQT